MTFILKKRFIIILITAGFLTGFGAYPVRAQVSSLNGWFTADFSKACAPFTIHLTETDTFPPETVRQYSFEGDGFFVGFNSGDPVEYTYTRPGTYKLVEVINKDYTGKTDTLEITVYNSTKPSFTIYTCEGDGVTIKIKNDEYDQYRIYFTATDTFDLNKGAPAPSFVYPPGTHSISVKGLYYEALENCGIASQDFNTINNLIQAGLQSVSLSAKDSRSGSVTLDYTLAPDVVYQLERAENIPAGFKYQSGISGNTYIADSIDTRNKIQIFRIAAYDACHDKYLYSDTLAAVSISVTAENNQNHIVWNTYPVAFSSYDLIRDGQPFKSLSNANINYYIDKEVTCFNTYCYALTYQNSKGHRSYSDTACVEAFSIYYPPPVINTTVSAAGKGYDLSWIPPDNVDIKEYFVQRILDRDIYSTLDTVTAIHASDTSVDNTTGSFCYSISYLDQCKNRSNIGYTGCSMYLTLSKDNRLSWNEYSGWQNGVKKYILEIYDESGNLQEEIDMGGQTGYQVEDFYKQEINSYRVRAISNDPDPFVAYSNYVIKTLTSVINVPNSFTPDGDGLNDSFKPVGTEMKEFMMKVYTRKGNLIFESDDQHTGWDGSYNGAPVPQDTYIFDIIAEDFQGRSFRFRGALVLLRH